MSVIALMTSIVACGNKTNENETNDAIEIVELVNDTVSVDTVAVPCDSLVTDTTTAE